MHPSTYQTVFKIEPRGHMTVRNEVNLKGKLGFCDAIDITTDSAYFCLFLIQIIQLRLLR